MGWAARALALALVLGGGASFPQQQRRWRQRQRFYASSTSEDVLREKMEEDNNREVLSEVIPEVDAAAPAPAAAPAKEQVYDKDAVLGERPYLQIIAERGLETLDEIIVATREKFDAFMEDEDMAAATRPPPPPKGERERVVVLGTGWGAYSFLKSIDAAEKYDVVVISPRNYFLFTPMLAGAAVGTVEYRSITEPIRRVNEDADYLEATVTEIDPERKVVTAQSVVCEGMSCDIEDFELSYDKLVVSVGATTNTFGIKGVKENCAFLKQIEDAARLRSAIGNVFERANIPSLTDEQRRQALTFVVIGAGPTGVEFTSELRDFLAQDAPRYYPELLQYVRVVLVEATGRILGAFDEDMANAAKASLERDGDNRVPCEVIVGVGVNEVKEREVLLADGRTIPYGISVWAAGIGPLPLTLDTINRIPEQKTAQDENTVPRGGRGRLLTDGWLRVRGAPDIFALGDCAIMDTQPLPATAQVASQQATFLARLLSGDYDVSEPVPTVVGPNIRASDKFFPIYNKFVDAQVWTHPEGDVARQEVNEGAPFKYAKPFQFLNLGILAYVGNDRGIAQLQVNKTPVKSKGVAGWLLWRSIYLSKQVSWRNRALVAADWVKARIFGRDITRL